MKRVWIRTLLSRGRGATCVIGVPKVLQNELGWVKGDKVSLSIENGVLHVSKVDGTNGTHGRVVNIKHGIIEIEQEE